MASVSTNPKRQTIPKSIKTNVWNAYVGPNRYEIKCWCCRAQLIRFSEWTCGHVVSDAEGGEVSVQNLRPVCFSCNSSMGSKNMKTFMLDYGFITEEYEFYDYGTCYGIEDYAEHEASVQIRLPEKKVEERKAVELNNKNAQATRKANEFATAMSIIEKTKQITIRDGGTIVCVVTGQDIPTLWRGVTPWGENRPISEKRAQWLAKAEKELKETCGRYEFSSPATTLCILEKNIYLIDGQHRHRAFEILNSPPDSEWLIHVVKCSTHDMVAQHFEWLNNGTPVPAAYYNRKTRDMIDETFVLFARQYPDILTEGDTKRPKLTRVNARDALSKVSVIADGIKFGQLTSDAIYDAIIAANKRQTDRYRDNPELEKSKQCLEAAKKKGFYLGLVKNWELEVGSEINAILQEKEDIE
jgi:hypothetical protein